MAEVKQYVFTYQEVVEALIKKQDLHEGIWAVYLEFGIAGANIQSPEGGVAPSAIVPVTKIGLQKVDAISPIAVNAAVVNPAKKKN